MAEQAGTSSGGRGLSALSGKDLFCPRSQREIGAATAGSPEGHQPTR
jgi:hypothetical protein